MDRAGAVAPDCGCGPEVGGDWLRVGLGAVISGQLMVLSLALNLSDVDPATHTRLSVALVVLTALGVALLGPGLAAATREAWRRGDASLEAMFVLALLGGVGASLWGLATGGDVFFEVVTVVLTVHALGARLKARFWAAAIDRAGFGGLFPSHATVSDAGALVRRPIDALVAGDRVIARPGDRVPADGHVVDGGAWIDTSAVDGALAPAWTATGAPVPAGALVSRGSVTVRLDAAPDDSAHERALSAIVAAWSAVGVTSQAARRLARWFAPTVAAVAATAGLGWTWVDGPSTGFRVATAVLLVACPCGLGVATPVAAWAAAAALGRHGIVVRRPGALEALAQARVVALDKTGTLTDVAPEARWAPADGVDLPALRRRVGAVQAFSDHPVAVALRAPSDGVVSDLVDLPGGGVEATVTDADGTARVAVAPSPGPERAVDVRVDGETRARITFAERVADGASELVGALAARGLDVHVLTGDGADPELGVPCVTGVRPDDKAGHVALLQERGPVVFVGDAANDLAAMTRADVAVSVSGASAVVSRHADVAVRTAADLPSVLDAAHGLTARLRRLLALSATGNVIGMGVAAAGLLHPVFAAMIMAGTSLGVTLAAVPGAADDR